MGSVDNEVITLDDDDDSEIQFINVQQPPVLEDSTWFCHECKVQCGNEDGLVKHLTSDAHIHKHRQLNPIVNPFRNLDECSKKFARGFLDCLKIAYGTSTTRSDIIYDLYTSQQDSVELADTKWTTWSGFVKWVAREGHCTVSETEEGQIVGLKDNDNLGIVLVKPKRIRRTNSEPDVIELDSDDTTTDAEGDEEPEQNKNKRSRNERESNAGSSGSDDSVLLDSSSDSEASPDTDEDDEGKEGTVDNNPVTTNSSEGPPANTTSSNLTVVQGQVSETNPGPGDPDPNPNPLPSESIPIPTPSEVPIPKPEPIPGPSQPRPRRQRRLSPSILTPERQAKMERKLLEFFAAVDRKDREEVDFNDDADDHNSAYIQKDRMITQVVKFYEKVAKACGGNGVLTGRPLQKIFSIKKVSKIPEIDHAVEKFLNNFCKPRVRRKKEVAYQTPDYNDILRVVDDTITSKRLVLVTGENEKIAKDLFKYIVKLYKKRRAKDGRIALPALFDSGCQDPADKDPELRRKLEENDRKRRTEAEVLKEFVVKQGEQEAEAGDEEDEDEDEDDEDNDNDNDNGKATKRRRVSGGHRAK